MVHVGSLLLGVSLLRLVFRISRVTGRALGVTGGWGNCRSWRPIVW